VIANYRRSKIAGVYRAIGHSHHTRKDILMARSKKKALSQQVVGVATTGMPSPVRKFLGGRIIALLIVIVTPILFATGVVSVKWENGRPRISFNQKRAAEVRKETANKIEAVREEVGHDPGVLEGVLSDIGGTKKSNFMAELQPTPNFGDTLSDGVKQVRESIGGTEEQGFSLIPGAAKDEPQGGTATRLKQLFDKRR
jgi:hypothetical protein